MSSGRLLALLLGAAALAACDGASMQQSAARAPCLSDIAMPDPAVPFAGMIEIKGGTMTMGAKPMHREEGPPQAVSVDTFWIDRTDVTNAQFAAFVAATGHVTRAERAGADGEPPSSIVFVGAAGMVDLNDPAQWWRVVDGADWRHPLGPDSTIEGRETLPVVHVAYEDALAYAQWLGRDLPSEAEWEYAARGGLDGARYVWGEQPVDVAAPRANTWQGLFPLQDMGDDGFKAETSPVGCFGANGYGLFDMAGNVWQWTKDVWTPDLAARRDDQPLLAAFDPAAPNQPERVIKGGSFLCADNFCFRYRPAARTGAAPGDGTSHIGFRTVWRPSSQSASDIVQTAESSP